MNIDPQGRTIFKDKNKGITYIKGKLLGTGGFAKCYQVVQSSTGHLYAAKVIPKKSINEKRQRYKLLIQIKIHRSLKHKNIVQFIDAFQDKENIYILLEYCRNYTLKDLAKRRKRLTQFQTRMYIGQIVKALIYIHSQGIIHRDLKLGNILINDEMEAKICDFGLSTRIKNEGQAKKTICGTPNYIAPQILQQQGHSYQVDIWSIGVIMYALLFGKPPFEDQTVDHTYENIKNNRYVFPPSISVSLAAKDLINRILIIDPAKRLSLQEILQHQFMLFPQGVPRSLPLSSLAVPPLDYHRLPDRVNLNDMNIELSQDLQQSHNKQQISIEKHSLPIYVRQCFKYKQNLGYLLSSGLVGSYSFKTGATFLLQFGQQYYYLVQRGKKQKKIAVPDEFSDDANLLVLFNFKSFFVQKYSLFKMQQMKKRTKQLQNMGFMQRALQIQQGQFLTRLDTQVVQLTFQDLTSLAINRQDDTSIFYINSIGQIQQINYNQCKNARIKTKIRRFSKIIQRLSPNTQSQSQMSISV